MKEKPCQIMLRVSQDTRDEIERRAAAEEPSIANLTRVILEQWLATHPRPERSIGTPHACAVAAAE